ncbi:type IV pilus assembly protein FimV [Jeongeupia chitinilytica]|uniref:FimV N-terminal domain-containing protein n=1 Tax=Jeongeupia chitinilytica TaxID=1041641 RepID=A0ABQ3H3D6_9NEIS|nr:hypothetical protein [Jeongeupia chitinilytica]GHD65594.1 hypothetical protein GCM10007350_26290 [Jeongeupia chitinilytica]
MNASPLSRCLMTLLLGLPAAGLAATLGELQVHSALGERFDASIPVRLGAGENLGSACFRLVPDAVDGDAAALVNARLRYQGEGGRGELQIVGTEPLQEPMLQLVVRVQCRDDEQPRFQRSYNVLVDPRDYAMPRGSRRATPVRNERRYPALGGSLRVAEGDTVSQLARHYFPDDRAARARFVDALYQQNPDLPQGLDAPLPEDVLLALPRASSAVEATPKPVVPPLRLAPQPADTLSVTVPEPLPQVPALPASQATQVQGEFRLQLSSPSLDLGRESELSPEERLKLRERLLTLTSDDQTSQLMALKYQVAQLEKQLNTLRQGEPAEQASAVKPRSREAGDDGLSPWWLSLLLLIPLGFVAWRWRTRQQDYGDAFSLAHPRESDGTLSLRPVTLPPSEPRVRTALGATTLVQNIGQIADEFHNEDVDVVLPGNVSEEAQLLIDHGLIQQAINLLNHEIEQHPTVLVLWMKLFDVYRQNDMKQPFQERAVAFRLQFASDALWQQVQSIGLRVDPENPLYRSLDDSIDHQLDLGKSAGPILADEAFDFAAVMHQDAGLAPPSSVVELPEAHDDYDGVPPLPTIEELDFQLEPFGESPAILATPAPAPHSGDGERFQADPADFVSNDPQLQQVARHLALGEQDAAYQLLEQALLHGSSMEQRLTAMKWLDKLAPVRSR